MSTFKGVIQEFPDIRIDYFRRIPEKTPPLACFLSHVHSDHLQGLESLRSPFVYCSPATRELLLRLEKYPHRMNFARGILESRKQEYKHLKNLLKTIPLNTPTEIELTPNKVIRVTLLDANHCAGAVMFLIEKSTTAVLYTGDIRSEPWWVNALVRNPVLVPYSLGDRCLDKIYLDTTFAAKKDAYRTFPTKADGIKELLAKVSDYPDDTVFHFHAWTFGYEDVWVALASALQSRIHVDRYKWRLYKSLISASGDGVLTHEGPALCGFKCANKHQPGCLTNDQSVRLHSCEHGTECNAMDSPTVVRILPIITRTRNGEDVRELGAGGGMGDLVQSHEIELNDTMGAIELMKLCSEKIEDPKARSSTLALISGAMGSSSKALSLDNLDLDDQLEDMPLEEVTRLLRRIAERMNNNGGRTTGTDSSQTITKTTQQSPRTITFPYSRHSSYDELCHLVKAFKPRDVYPCTTDEENWNHSVSMKALFGHVCSTQTFAHDQEMMMLEDEGKSAGPRKRKHQETKENIGSQRSHSASSQVSEIDHNTTLVEEGISTPGRQVTAEFGDATSIAKKPRLSSSQSEASSQIAKTKATPTTSDASTSTSHDLRVHALKLSFEGLPRPPKSAAIPLNRTVSAPVFGSDGIVEFVSTGGSAGLGDLRKPEATVTTACLPAKDSSIPKMATQYKCKWLGCDNTYPFLHRLRHHVINKHCIQVGVGQATAFGCLWADCPNPNDVKYFKSQELWEEHMDRRHYHAEVHRGEDRAIEPRTAEAPQRSHPSLPFQVINDHATNGAVTQPGRTQVHAIELSDESSHSSDGYEEDQNDDIKLEDITDVTLRKMTGQMVRELDCSIIMARTLVVARGYVPARRYLAWESENADYRTKSGPVVYLLEDQELSNMILRLRDLLPTADEESCQQALIQNGYNFRRARDQVAAEEEVRLSDVSEVDFDGDDDDVTRNDKELDNNDRGESQVSLPDSAFASQQPSRLSGQDQPSPSGVRHRKEAYKAAKGIHGRTWATFSPISSSNTHTDAELELG